MLSKRPREGSLLFLLIGNRRERRPRRSDLLQVERLCAIIRIELEKEGIE